MSQNSWQVPTGGSESATTFAGQCNAAWLALASMNSGASAPANGPGSAPVQFLLWANTTLVALPDISIFDGVNWPRIGTLDVSGSNWLPKMGGGQTTIASAATLDIGASRQTTIFISGSASISTLGTSATIGERKRLQFTGQATLVNSANITCPGGTSIVANAGDRCEVEYNGSNAWNVNWYTEGNASIGGGVQVGDCIWNPYQTGDRPGWTRANGNTVGDASSNATGRANADTFNLFVYLWTNAFNDPEFAIYTSGGVLTTRGASAAADWAVHKAITTTDMRGRGAWGVDAMGAAAGAASRVTSTTASPNGTTQGGTFGAQAVTLAQGNLPSVNFTFTAGNSYAPGTINLNQGPNGNQNFVQADNVSPNQVATGVNVSALANPHANTPFSALTVTLPSYTPTGSAASGGSATAVNKMPPGKLGTWFQKL